MSFRMASPAVAVEADIVLNALLAFESVCFYRLHLAFIASYSLVEVALQLQTALKFFDALLLLYNIVFEKFFVCSEHFNFSCQRRYAIMVLDFALL